MQATATAMLAGKVERPQLFNEARTLERANYLAQKECNATLSPSYKWWDVFDGIDTKQGYLHLGYVRPVRDSEGELSFLVLTVNRQQLFGFTIHESIRMLREALDTQAHRRTAPH